MRGHVHDIEQIKSWVETAVTGNPLGIYTTSTANYPPLALLPMVIMGHLHRALSPAEYESSPVLLTALIKVPGIAADLITAVALYFIVQRQYSGPAEFPPFWKFGTSFPKRRQWATVALAAYAFNPAVWYVSAWWGQLESLVTLPMLLSLEAACRRHFGWAWGFFAAAVLVKPQAVIIGPVVLLAAWQWGGRRAVLRGGIAAAVVSLLVLSPFLIVGQILALIAQIQASTGRQLFLTMNAHNLWYLLTWGQGSFAAREGSPLLDTEPLLGPFTGWQVGLTLFAGWALLVVWKFGRIYTSAEASINSGQFGSTRGFFEGGVQLYGAGTAMVMGFYMLPAEAHERYLFPALALMVPLLPLGRPFRWVYGILTLTFLLNLLWVDPAVPLPGFAQVLGWGVPLSAVNLGLMVYFYRRMKRQ
jgi:Gpi18-like mannosyltransferase